MSGPQNDISADSSTLICDDLTSMGLEKNDNLQSAETDNVDSCGGLHPDDARSLSSSSKVSLKPGSNDRLKEKTLMR